MAAGKRTGKKKTKKEGRDLTPGIRSGGDGPGAQDDAGAEAESSGEGRLAISSTEDEANIIPHQPGKNSVATPPPSATDYSTPSDVVDTRQRKVMSHNAKYKSAFAVCQRIAEVVADKGTTEYQLWLDGLQRIERNARDNDTIVQGFDMTTSAKNDTEKDMDSAAEDVYVEDVLRSHSDGHTAGKKRAAFEDSTEVSEESGLVVKRRLILDTSDVDAVDNFDSNECEAVKDAGNVGAASDLEEKTSSRVESTVPLIDLNTASRPSGRPRLQQAVKKSKQKTEFKESEDLARRLTTLGDITLESFSKLVQQQSLPLSDVEENFDALRPMHSDAVFKRPKARLLEDGAANIVEDKVRGILPEALVKKSLIAVHNLITRTKSSTGISPSRDIIAVAILNVGTFRATDIDTMEEWHTVSKLVRGARSLISWINGVDLQDPAQEEDRQQIVSCINTLDMRGSINSGGQEVEFAELVRFGNEGWLSDQCMVSAATRIAAEGSRTQPPAIYVINPTFARFKDDEQRRSLIDSKDFIFSKCHDGMAMLIPVYLDIDFGHWCGVIVDITRRVIWIYDPFHKAKHEEAVQLTVQDAVVSLIDPAYKLEIRVFRAWLQRDGFSCGVFVAHWFDYYTTNYLMVPEDDVVVDTPPMTKRELEMCRYKIFCYVFDSMSVNLTE